MNAAPPDNAGNAQQYQCPHCNAILETDSRIEGTRITCPECGKEFVAFQHKPVTMKVVKPRSKKKRIIGIVLLVLALLFMFAMCSGDQTVDQYRANLVRAVNDDLSNPGSQPRKRIESAHLTVTVKNAYVVRCEMSTIDGSDLAGPDGDNIRAMSMLIRFEWEGFIDSGYTDLRINCDAVNARAESDIEYTTAFINVEDSNFWVDIGWMIGSML